MEDTIKKTRDLLKSDFENKLFDASIGNLKDESNHLRYHNFCYSIRELSRHFLNSLSPDDSVLNCSWFKKLTANGKPTRAQRIKYAIQGGLSDELLEVLGFDLDTLKDTIKDIKSIIDSLSKYTHINPENFELSDKQIENQSVKVLKSFERFVEIIQNLKEELNEFLDGIIEDDMVDSILSNHYENVDLLAPHFSIHHGGVEQYHIAEITDSEIIVNVYGYLDVVLEYGSRKERREDDGLDLNESFPFETKIRYTIEEDFPTDSYYVDTFDVDTSSWYGDEEGYFET